MGKNDGIIVGAAITIVAIGIAVYELFFANPDNAESTLVGGSTGGGGASSQRQPSQNAPSSGAASNVSTSYSANGVTYQTNTGTSVLGIQGSGQTLSPGSTLVSISGGPSYISTPAGYNGASYDTSLNTSSYGTPTGAATTLTASNTAVSNGIPNAQAGDTVQSTSNGFYAVTTPEGVVYTNINPEQSSG